KRSRKSRRRSHRPRQHRPSRNHGYRRVSLWSTARRWWDSRAAHTTQTLLPWRMRAPEDTAKMRWRYAGSVAPRLKTRACRNSNMREIGLDSAVWENGGMCESAFVAHDLYHFLKGTGFNSREL